MEREREQRRTHRPCEPAAPRATPRCGREGVLLYACTLYYCMAVALPRMRLPSSCPPPNGITYTVSSAASSLASSSSSSPSPHQQHHRAGALHYSLLPRGQRHRTRLYHGWSARVATCARAPCSTARSLACPLSDVRISMLPIISYPEVISQTSLPPYNKSPPPALGPRGLSLALPHLLLALAGSLP